MAAGVTSPSRTGKSLATDRIPGPWGDEYDNLDELTATAAAAPMMGCESVVSTDRESFALVRIINRCC